MTYGISRSFVRDGVTETYQVAYTDSNTFTYTDTLCEPDTEYTYTVMAGGLSPVGAMYGKGMSLVSEKESEPKTITTAKDSKGCLSYPASFKVDSVEGNENELSLSWNAVQGASKYRIYERFILNSKDMYDYTNYYETTDTFFTVENLYNTMKYEYQVQALGENGTYGLKSVRIAKEVPEMTNVSLSTAYSLENGKSKCYCGGGWFKIKPEKGEITISTREDDETFSLLSADKKICVSNKKFTVSAEDELKADLSEIPGFVSGNEYYLRFSIGWMYTVTVK